MSRYYNLHWRQSEGEDLIVDELIYFVFEFFESTDVLLFNEKFSWSTFCGKSPWSNILWKISLIKYFVENFLHHFFCGKFPWLRKISLIKYFVENFLDQGKFLWIQKNSLIKEIFLDCGKLTFLTAKIIGLIIWKQLRHIFWS